MTSRLPEMVLQQGCHWGPFSGFTIRRFISPVFLATLAGIQRTFWVLEKQNILSALVNFPFKPSQGSAEGEN